MIGKTLAHYEVTDRLGKGGMGEVFLRRISYFCFLPDSFTHKMIFA